MSSCSGGRDEALKLTIEIGEALVAGKLHLTKKDIDAFKEKQKAKKLPQPRAPLSLKRPAAAKSAAAPQGATS